jgi:hypothetical protein
MSREWETFEEIVCDRQAEIEANQIIETYVMDHETYERIYVKAIISKDPTRLPDGEKLWVRDFSGKLKPEYWAIKIVEVQSPISSALLREDV